MMSKHKKILLFILIFAAIYLFPLGSESVQQALMEAFFMLQYYAQEHVLLCLIPAFFVAGAIGVFISQQGVLKYFGGQAQRWISYSVASVSGVVLAVCSCTVLPLFAGLYRRGAGLGPATAFLYSGPAINILAIILTARILGWQMGVARAIGAVIFALVIGLLMAVIFAKEEKKREAEFILTEQEEEARNPLQNLIYFGTLVLILIFAAWSQPEQSTAFWDAVYNMKWYISAGLLIVLAIILKKWFQKEELTDWLDSTWYFAELILPLLLAGVLIAGFLMGRPGTEQGIIPSEWVARFVGGNGLGANLTAAVLGAFMYFATLTEVPILQGLLGLGMGEGPALALLLAGPALSLPNMLVINSVLGIKKTVIFIILVVIMATISGLIYGNWVL